LRGIEATSAVSGPGRRFLPGVPGRHRQILVVEQRDAFTTNFEFPVLFRELDGNAEKGVAGGVHPGSDSV
jgi:hypothetical protein